ncbi:hypothetical protein K2173_009757 [Erythroxylum novogranatense]|uniref:Protein ENDOSPERM DEFECTIVE 1 n=1 Tax=Erythroxylum novogranatense TaxID=1862640 RepID=A0AAV8SYW1_9ROSI|nr:hypothetical protein K2173_009757 [Erythroxylum novogranatense]
MTVEESSSTAMSTNLPQPPPPPRRPRVREVSSRFMTPVASHSSSSSTFSPLPTHRHRSTSAQRQRNHLDPEPLDENPALRNEQRGQRPDTPIVNTCSSLSSAKLRLIQHRSTSNVSAATKLFQSSGISTHSHSTDSFSSSSSSLSRSSSDCHENNTETRSSTRSLPDLRSSMPEADMLPNVSSRLLTERNVNRPIGTTPADSSKTISASPCSRSLNLKTVRQLTGSVKTPGLPLPPMKVTNDGGKKSRKEEDVHNLKMLHNRYLQWRYANAKAEASMQNQRKESERNLYSLAVKLSELSESVKRKRIELGILHRVKTISTIVEAQMPYLDEWSDLEADYSVSLSEATQALLNTSLRLPTSGNVRIDVKEVEETLNCATKMMESIAMNTQSFMPKAQETELLASELARVTGGERGLVEECGVEECSLRGQLIQLQRICHD